MFAFFRCGFSILLQQLTELAEIILIFHLWKVLAPIWLTLSSVWVPFGGGRLSSTEWWHHQCSAVFRCLGEPGRGGF